MQVLFRIKDPNATLAIFTFSGWWKFSSEDFCPFLSSFQGMQWSRWSEATPCRCTVSCRREPGVVHDEGGDGVVVRGVQQGDGEEGPHEEPHTDPLSRPGGLMSLLCDHLQEHPFPESPHVLVSKNVISVIIFNQSE